MKEAVAYINGLISADLHNYVMVTLVSLYSLTALVMLYEWRRTGVPSDLGLLKEIGGTVIWWGGIIAGAHTGKSMMATFKGSPTETKEQEDK